MHHIMLEVVELNKFTDILSLPRAYYVWVGELLFLAFFGKEEPVFSPEEFVL